MQEGTKLGKNLYELPDSFPNKPNIDDRTELLNLLEALTEKIKLLETKEAAVKKQENSPLTSPNDEVNCNFKTNCYVAKSKMGTCPCELHR